MSSTTELILLGMIVGLPIFFARRFLPRRRNRGRPKRLPTSPHTGVLSLSGPIVERIRALADLVILEAPITDLQVHTIGQGPSATNVVVLVRGSIQLATDLSQASVTVVNQHDRSVRVRLSPIRMRRPRIDFERSLVWKIERGTLTWLCGARNEDAVIIPFKKETNDKKLTWLCGARNEDAVTQALRYAQRSLAEVLVEDAELMALARRQAEYVLQSYFRATGTTAEICWEGNVSQIETVRDATPLTPLLPAVESAYESAN